MDKSFQRTEEIKAYFRHARSMEWQFLNRCKRNMKKGFIKNRDGQRVIIDNDFFSVLVKQIDGRQLLLQPREKFRFSITFSSVHFFFLTYYILNSIIQYFKFYIVD